MKPRLIFKTDDSVYRILEYVGRVALDFNSPASDVKRVTDSLLKQLREAIEERT